MKKTIINRLVVVLLFSGCMAQAQVGIGTSSPNSASILDLTSSQKGLLLPRVASTSVILNPINGLLIYDLSSNCLKAFENGAWTDCGLVQIPSIVALDSSPGFNPQVAKFSTAYSGTTTTSYTGGNGVAYSKASYASTGVTGLTLTLAAGTLASGSGTLLYTVTGTPSAAGTASFSISFLGKSFTKTIAVYGCGAFVDSGVFKEFMCHNLGANTSLDPDIPVQGIGGNYYQWGRAKVVADASSSPGKIAGYEWSDDTVIGAWSDYTKTANDPCPSGYKIPTKEHFNAIMKWNEITFTGSWVSDVNNFNTALSFGIGETKTLTFPAMGSRDSFGMLVDRGRKGFYWSSTEELWFENNFWYYALDISKTGSSIFKYNAIRDQGYSIRCIAE
jgi:uncharacterized protein (TIGR02145 family)